VERALKLIVSGTLTIDIARPGNGKMITLPRVFNQFSGKESNHVTSFNDTTWGDPTRHYSLSTRQLSRGKYEAIVQGAQRYLNLKPSRARKMLTEAAEVIVIDDDDGRACPPSSDDDDCKLLYVSVTLLT
jgi:hypothetical protein